MSENQVPAKTITISGVTFTVWCDGRNYDPSDESYRARYGYSIVSDKWRYESNDISGNPNGLPNIELASTALLAMLLSCAEAPDDDEHAELFPPHVRELAQSISGDLMAFCADIT